MKQKKETTAPTKINLPNWRAAASVMVLVSTILFGVEACTHQENAGVSFESQKDWGGLSGWTDNDTFLINATGASTKKVADPEKQKEEARRAAILFAQYRIVDTFKGYILEGATGIMADEPYFKASLATLKQLAKEGKIVAEKYDDEGNCEILYELKKNGLRKYIQIGGWIKTE